ncbi:hypothetical protein GQ607_013319 [Colletotrichum asianum]|uniref:Uncharacterized protein n=1 Tax=Colletotrichum asianum TaxID=702518 RepID=A0A8H3W426_9PEZI|nr:hypothetical protein GQ607_013319 [Colletotrichum asianum]
MLVCACLFASQCVPCISSNGGARKCTHQKHRRHATQSRPSRFLPDSSAGRYASHSRPPPIGIHRGGGLATCDLEDPGQRLGPLSLTLRLGRARWVKSGGFGSLDRLGRDRLLLPWASLAVSRTRQAHLKHGWSTGVVREQPPPDF